MTDETEREPLYPASWPAVPGAASYEVRYSEVPTEGTIHVPHKMPTRRGVPAAVLLVGILGVLSGVFGIGYAAGLYSAAEHGCPTGYQCAPAPDWDRVNP